MKGVLIGLCLAAALIGLQAAFAPRSMTGVNPRAFWIQKARCRGCAEVVLAGSSRLYRGLDPEKLMLAWPGKKIINLAFSAQGYSPAYLAAVKQALVPTGQRTLVLDATALAFTPWAARAGHYVRWSKVAAGAGLVESLRQRIDALLPRAEPCELLFSACARSYKQHYSDSGFVASDKTPIDEREFEPTFERVFRASQVDPAIVGAVADTIRELHAAGVRVYVVRPPVPASMQQIEQAYGRFDEARVRTALVAAGAHWLDVGGSFRTFDGSHLQSAEATRYSEAMAAAIQILEQGSHGVSVTP